MDQPQTAPRNPGETTQGAISAVGDLSVALATQGGRPQVPQAIPPEEDLWSGRMHWQNAFGRVTLWVTLNIGFFVAAFYAPQFDWLTRSRLVWTIAGLFAITSVIVLGGVAIRVWNTRYRLTSQRLFIERGILSRTVDQTELIRVDDVQMKQSFVNRICNIGTIILMTTDATDRTASIIGIKDPSQVTELIRRQMRTLRGKSLFVENL